MKKPPKRKPVITKPSLPQLTVATNHTKPKPESKATPRAQLGSTDTKITFAKSWKEFWSFAGPAFTIIAATAYWWPVVAVTSGANLDSNQDFQTQFIVTNAGHVPVHDVSFACALVGERASFGSLKTSGGTLETISTLKPNELASRGCFLESIKIDGPMLRIDAYYRWPLIGRLASTRAYFAVRRGTQGVVLVPEAAPSPEPPVILVLGRPPQS